MGFRVYGLGSLGLGLRVQGMRVVGLRFGHAAGSAVARSQACSIVFLKASSLHPKP